MKPSIPRTGTSVGGRRSATLLTALALALSATSGAGQEERFGESADVVLVQIPVHATRDGQPVRGLTEANFEVLEGRKKQPIVAVDVFDLTSIPVDASRLDAASVHRPAGATSSCSSTSRIPCPPASSAPARRPSNLARKGFHPTDLAAVATYSKSRGIELVMGFSSDRLQLEAALANLGLLDPFERLSDPLRLSVAEYGDSLSSNPNQGGGAGIGGQRMAAAAALLESLEDLSVMDSRSNRDQVKQQIIDLSSNMDSLAKLLDSASGRKQIVMFSQGFDSEVVFGTQDRQRVEEIVQPVVPTVEGARAAEVLAAEGSPQTLILGTDHGGRRRPRAHLALPAVD